MQKLIATNIEISTYVSLKRRVRALHRDVSKHLRALIEEDIENARIAEGMEKDSPIEEE